MVIRYEIGIYIIVADHINHVFNAIVRQYTTLAVGGVAKCKAKLINYSRLVYDDY